MFAHLVYAFSAAYAGACAKEAFDRGDRISGWAIIIVIAFIAITA